MLQCKLCRNIEFPQRLVVDVLASVQRQVPAFLLRSRFGSRFTAPSVENFGPLFPCRYETFLTSSLLICMETFVKFSPLCACTGKALARQPLLFGSATSLMVPRPRNSFCNLSRHITGISSNHFRVSIRSSIKTFAATSRPDEVQTVCTAPAQMIEHVAPSPVIDCTAPLSATTGVFTDFENPQFSILAVEAAASQVVDSFSSGC